MKRWRKEVEFAAFLPPEFYQTNDLANNHASINENFVNLITRL